jgi:type II secretory pathway component PulJ
VTNAVILILLGGLFTWQMNGRFKALESRMDRLESRMDRLERAVDAMRSDLTQVALAVGARPQLGPAPDPGPATA